MTEIKLRKFNTNDINELIDYTNDEAIILNSGFLPIKNYSEAINFIINQDKYTYCISDLDNNLIGFIQLEFNDKVPFIKDNEAMISLWVAHKYWGNGYGPKACELLIDKAFNELNIERLYYGFFSGNNNSKRVKEKLGFKYFNSHSYYFKHLNQEVEVEDYVLDKKDYLK